PHHVRVAHEQLVAEWQERVDEQHLLPAHLVEGGGPPAGVLRGHPAAHVEDGHAPEVEFAEQFGVHGAYEEVVDPKAGEVVHPGEDEVEEGVVAKGDHDDAVAGARAHHVAGEAEGARRGHPRTPRRRLPNGAVVHGLRLCGGGCVGSDGGGDGGEGERGRCEGGEGEEEEEGGDSEAAEDGAEDPDEDRLGGFGGAPRRHFVGRGGRVAGAGSAGSSWRWGQALRSGHSLSRGAASEMRRWGPPDPDE
ncbi:hypothetical protein BRADI_3g45952v3, partial [Brachypodium distachyon]